MNTPSFCIFETIKLKPMLSTTELFVEHIISGILSLVWIIAAMLCFTGVDPMLWAGLKDYWAVVLLIGTAVAYPVGILVDTTADLMLEGLDKQTKRKHRLPDDFSLLLRINQETPANVVNYFIYNRFKTRVARSSFVNFALIGFIVAILLRRQGAAFGIDEPLLVSAVVFLTFNLLAAAAFFLWWKIANTVYKKAGRVWPEDQVTGQP